MSSFRIVHNDFIAFFNLSSVYCFSIVGQQLIHWQNANYGSYAHIFDGETKSELHDFISQKYCL